MTENRRLLFAIADGEHVRFVRPAADGALYSDTTMGQAATRHRPADFGTDHRADARGTGPAFHDALQVQHDPLPLAKENFGQAVAAQLNAASAANAFDELVIVAPPRMLAAIHQNLDTASEGKVIGTLRKDLAKTPDQHLWPHLQDWVRPGE